MTYNHSHPIANLFTTINDYANMEKVNGVTETPVPRINIGLIVLTRASLFAKNVRIWQALPNAHKSWLTFKKIFRTAQRAIKQIQTTTTTETIGYHQSANAAAIIYEFVIYITTLSSDKDSKFSTPTSPQQAAEQQAEQKMQKHLASIT